MREQDKILDKFTQAMDKKGAPLRQGIGLRLAFCQMAIEAQFGRIWVESSQDSGSTFFFTLPMGEAGESEIS